MLRKRVDDPVEVVDNLTDVALRATVNSFSQSSDLLLHRCYAATAHLSARHELAGGSERLV